jgi:hypothetical protein
MRSGAFIGAGWVRGCGIFAGGNAAPHRTAPRLPDLSDRHRLHRHSSTVKAQPARARKGDKKRLVDSWQRGEECAAEHHTACTAQSLRHAPFCGEGKRGEVRVKGALSPRIFSLLLASLTARGCLICARAPQPLYIRARSPRPLRTFLWRTNLSTASPQPHHPPRPH